MSVIHNLALLPDSDHGAMSMSRILIRRGRSLLALCVWRSAGRGRVTPLTRVPEPRLSEPAPRAAAVRCAARPRSASARSRASPRPLLLPSIQRPAVGGARE